MSNIFAKIFGVGESVSQPIEAVGNVLDKLFTSKEEVLNIEVIKQRLSQQPLVAQQEINKIEAQHRSVFVAGWRPFIGWVCGVSIAFYFIPQFALAAYIWASQSLAGGELLPYPADGAEHLFELVLAMLGMATLRSAEKFGKVAK
jgi:hypothetical protein